MNFWNTSIPYLEGRKKYSNWSDSDESTGYSSCSSSESSFDMTDQNKKHQNEPLNLTFHDHQYSSLPGPLPGSSLPDRKRASFNANCWSSTATSPTKEFDWDMIPPTPVSPVPSNGNYNNSSFIRQYYHSFGFPAVNRELIKSPMETFIKLEDHDYNKPSNQQLIHQPKQEPKLVSNKRLRENDDVNRELIMSPMETFIKLEDHDYYKPSPSDQLIQQPKLVSNKRWKELEDINRELIMSPMETFTKQWGEMEDELGESQTLQLATTASYVENYENGSNEVTRDLSSHQMDVPRTEEFSAFVPPRASTPSFKNSLKSSRSSSSALKRKREDRLNDKENQPEPELKVRKTFRNDRTSNVTSKPVSRNLQDKHCHHYNPPFLALRLLQGKRRAAFDLQPPHAQRQEGPNFVPSFATDRVLNLQCRWG